MRIVIIGAGIAGIDLAIRLKKLGMNPVVFESNEESELVDMHDERSVNITISHRGITALEQIDCADELRKNSMHVTGRMHLINDVSHFTPYTLRPGLCLYSIDRKALMRILIKKAKEQDVEIKFGFKLENIKFFDKTCIFLHKKEVYEYTYDFLFGIDGARSRVKSLLGVPYTETQSGYIYKKIDIDSNNVSRLKLNNNSVNIWPNPKGLFFTLPNKDGSHSGLINFTSDILDELESDEKLLKLYFPNLIRDVDNFCEKFRNTRTASFKEIHCDGWFQRKSVLLMGDAVHAMMPFYAQGANCALEDVSIFCKLLEENGSDLSKTSLDFEKNRPLDAYAICELSRKNLKNLKTEENFEEYLGLRNLELALEQKFPDYFSEYSMVAFTDIPYSKILDISKKRQPILLEYSNKVIHEVSDDLIKEIYPKL